MIEKLTSVFQAIENNVSRNNLATNSTIETNSNIISENFNLENSEALVFFALILVLNFVKKQLYWEI